eukprot:TRINITY_DN60746_c0_g1_i1.p1 TRINITY_DN60746_c0_g1~~TRINITY_DN60746_c0_g1_i1.p1  ORF type:complete len:170 (+),score=37.57 TRINITY_DN60746_c0_g1_i1:38-547(+)
MPTQIFEAPSFVLDWHQCNPPDPWMLGGVLKLHEFVTSPENLRAGRAGKCVYTSYLGEAEPTPAWARPLMSPLATLRQRLHGRWWIFPMAPPPPPADADDSWQLLHFRRAGTLYGIYLQFDYDNREELSAHKWAYLTVTCDMADLEDQEVTAVGIDYQRRICMAKFRPG